METITYKSNIWHKADWLFNETFPVAHPLKVFFWNHTKLSYLSRSKDHALNLISIRKVKLQKKNLIIKMDKQLNLMRISSKSSIKMFTTLFTRGFFSFFHWKICFNMDNILMVFTATPLSCIRTMAGLPVLYIVSLLPVHSPWSPACPPAPPWHSGGGGCRCPPCPKALHTLSPLS